MRAQHSAPGPFRESQKSTGFLISCSDLRLCFACLVFGFALYTGSHASKFGLRLTV